MKTSALWGQAVGKDDVTVSGRWRPILFQPDLFSPQQFVIGVLFTSDTGQQAHRLLESSKRFRCFYQGRLNPLDYEWLIEHIRRDISTATTETDFRFGSPHVSLGEPLFASGESATQIVARLFARCVELGDDDKEDNDFQSINTPKARLLVLNELKRIAGLDYERFARPDGVYRNVDGENRLFDIQLESSAAAGSIVSAWYSSSSTADINLLRASVEVSSYVNVAHLTNRGIFVFRPYEPLGIDARQWQDMTNRYDEETRKLELAGFRITTREHEEDLAKDILEWIL